MPFGLFKLAAIHPAGDSAPHHLSLGDVRQVGFAVPVSRMLVLDSGTELVGEVKMPIDLYIAELFVQLTLIERTRIAEAL